MRSDILVAVIFIGIIFLIPYSFGDAFDDILQEYEPGITLSKEGEQLLRELPEEVWKLAIKRYKEQKKKLEKLKKEMLKAPFLHFYCATMQAKGLLRFFNNQMTGCPTDYRPQFIPHIPVILVAEQALRDPKYTSNGEFKKMISKWYHFIHNTNNSYAKCVKENLELYQKHHADAFSDMNTLYPAFYASVARSSFLFHYLLRLLVSGMKDGDKTFFTILRERAPFYYFDKTDVDFLNVLVISRNLNQPIDENMFIGYIKTNFIPPFFENDPVYKTLENVVPQGDNCIQQKVGSRYHAMPYFTTASNVPK